jgi:Tol biopolymer transport system component
MRTRTCTAALVVTAGVLALGTGTASAATFAGTNGMVAFGGFDGADYEVFVVNPDGSGLTALTNNSTTNDLAPSWSGDGERIAFVRNATGNAEIAVMDHDGQNQVELTSDAADDLDPSFSPDGQKIAFNRPVGGDDQIWVMDADGQNQVQLTSFSEDSEQPQFSPDGRHIVFSRTLGGFRQIFVMDANGENQTQLTSVPMIDSFHASWFPDGNRIAFTRSSSSDPSIDPEIFSMNADGSDQTPITANDRGDSQAAVSPDAQLLISNRPAGSGATFNFDLFVQDLATGVQGPFLNGPNDEVDADWQPLNPPVIDLTAGKQRSAKKVTVTVVSESENATATLDGTLSAKKPKPKAAASKKKTVELDAVTLQLQPGVPVTVDVPVAGKGAKLLKKSLKAGKKPKGTITVTASDDLGASASDSQAVVYKKRKKKK